MLRKSGKSWWANLACRAKAQKMVKKHKSGIAVVIFLSHLSTSILGTHPEQGGCSLMQRNLPGTKL